jgi:hypothetical protein
MSASLSDGRHAVQGNLLKAKDELEKARIICDTDSSPCKQLQAAIDCTVTYLVIIIARQRSPPSGWPHGKAPRTRGWPLYLCQKEVGRSFHAGRAKIIDI